MVASQRLVLPASCPMILLYSMGFLAFPWCSLLFLIPTSQSRRISKIQPSVKLQIRDVECHELVWQPSVVCLVCSTRFLWWSDRWIASTSRLKHALATHSFAPQRVSSFPGRIIAASGKPSTWLPLGDLVEQNNSWNQFESAYVDSYDFIRVASSFLVLDAESLWSWAPRTVYQ